MTNLTLSRIRNTNLLTLYEKLIREEALSVIEIQALYKLSLIFINKGDKHTKKFGYKILLKTAFYDRVNRPIYDVTLNLGYYPITKLIENQYDENSHFINLFISAFLENFKEKEIYLTEQQLKMITEFRDNNDETVSVIAPTSYGKSELIMNLIADNTDSNICILVPTKALLSQTKKRVLKSDFYASNRKIITHPDMYQTSDSNFIAIFTQERLTRLLEKYPELIFQIAIIDEAHNLFNDDSRNRLLAATIAVLYKRNPEIKFKFLSPFLIDSDNLKVSFSDYDVVEQRITENLKINNFYCVDLIRKDGIFLYDQFLNKFIAISNECNLTDLDFIQRNASAKNIIYLNSPPKLEKVAFELSNEATPVTSQRLLNACNQIAAYLHNDYNLITCLKKGIVYHHGSVPDIIKLYVEELYSSETELKYIVCSSTLLEGVNIPAEKLFLLDYRKGRGRLSPSQFKNLSGRICRFNEIFSNSNSNLNLLEPEVYIIKSHYVRVDANIRKFLQDSVKEDKKLNDKMTNVLLQNTQRTSTNSTDFDKEEEFLVNFEPGFENENEQATARTDIGKLCFKNNIKEVNIINNEHQLNERVQVLLGADSKAVTAIEIIDMITFVFIDVIEEKTENNNILRLQHQKARTFYSMFLNWIMRSAPYSELIARFLAYWERIAEDNTHDGIVFVGKWGDLTRGGHRHLWVDIRRKSHSQRINLAILRIKEEQDFVENTIVKFVEVLNDLDLIEDDIYKKIKYGTADENLIIMIKNGYSISLAKLLLTKYPEYISINLPDNTITTNPAILDAMVSNSENDILIFEAKYNIKPAT